LQLIANRLLAARTHFTILTGVDLSEAALVQQLQVPPLQNGQLTVNGQLYNDILAAGAQFQTLAPHITDHMSATWSFWGNLHQAHRPHQITNVPFDNM
jgi:hypothetical protein